MSDTVRVLARLVLIGAPGAGKTRLGKRIARLLRVKFIDTDKTIVAEHGSIAQIFSEFGEDRFRTLERQAVSAALCEPAVVALGGGAVLNEQTQADLIHARVVQLTVSANAVTERIRGSKRPLLKDGLDDWVNLVKGRAPLYERLATRTWDTSTRPLDDIAAEVADWVRHDSIEQAEVQKEQSQ